MTDKDSKNSQQQDDFKDAIKRIIMEAEEEKNQAETPPMRRTPQKIRTKPPTRRPKKAVEPKKTSKKASQGSQGLSDNMRGLGMTLLLFILLVVSVFLYVNNEKSVPTITPKQAASLPWHRGGSLHDAKVYQWKEADDRNRLATSADIVNIHLVYDSAAQFEKMLRTKAEEFSTCVSQSAINSPDSTPVRSLFESCRHEIGLTR